MKRTAALFPGALPAQESGRIFTGLRREAVERFIAEMEGQPTTQGGFNAVTGQHDAFNMALGWHKHHAGRTGEVARWPRALSAAQARALEARLRP